jgi:hypothetical protein
LHIYLGSRCVKFKESLRTLHLPWSTYTTQYRMFGPRSAWRGIEGTFQIDVYIYVYIFVWIYIFIFIYMYIYIYICIYVYVYIYEYRMSGVRSARRGSRGKIFPTYMSVYKKIHLNTYMYIYIHICIYI